MNSAQKHTQLSKKLLGHGNKEINQRMDYAVKFLGAGHRIVGHYLGILDIIEADYGQKGRMEALLHLLIDAKVLEI